MARPPQAPGPPDADRIMFEAALSPMGHAFGMSSDGDARLALTVPASAARPLAEAMAAGRLNDRTFLVTILLAP